MTSWVSFADQGAPWVWFFKLVPQHRLKVRKKQRQQTFWLGFLSLRTNSLPLVDSKSKAASRRLLLAQLGLLLLTQYCSHWTGPQHPSFTTHRVERDLILKKSAGSKLADMECFSWSLCRFGGHFRPPAASVASLIFGTTRREMADESRAHVVDF